MNYPPAEREPLVENLFGHDVADPYRWLEDAGSPATRAWQEAQDELARRVLDELPGREWLRRRLTELLDVGQASAPAVRRDRAFYLRRDPGQEHAALIVRELDGSERALVDPGARDASGATTLDSWAPDHEGRLLAYQLSSGGTEESALRVLDVTTGDDVDGPIDRTRYSPVGWLPGGGAFYYVRRLPADQVPAGEEQYHRRVYLHRVGTDPAEDTVVFGDGFDKTTFFGVSVSHDGRWLVVTATEGTAPRNDVWLADLAAGDLAKPDLREVQRGVDAESWLRVGRDGRLYVLTDRDAPRVRLCVATPGDPAYENWRDLVPEDPEAVLDGYTILDGAELERPLLVVVRTRHAVGEVSTHDLVTGELVARVDVPGPGTVSGPTARPEGGCEAWLSYTDFGTPPRALRYDARTGEVEVWAATADGERPALSVEQVTYPSADGTAVRMFLIARDDAPAGPRPTQLYGYGGFNVSLTPGYGAPVLAWVEAGGTYAIANLRGGSEEGEEWHRAGRRERKQNVFDDFIAAAEWLVADGRTTPEQLCIHGGSNGGLLVGAAMTQRPDLFAAVCCSAPLLDMVRYEAFGLGQLWSDDYGTASVAEELAWLLGYSPYHHVRDGVDYPATLLTVFDSDTRVDPMHARKMCAALQHATSGDRPIVLRREADVGHGARAISRTVGLGVDVVSFLAARTGLLLPDD
jgi:prolyl oligopeptidase